MSQASFLVYPLKHEKSKEKEDNAFKKPLFTFIQLTDAHVGNPVNKPEHIRLREAVSLTNSLKPAFLIDTGDMTSHPVYEATDCNLAEYSEYKEYINLLKVPLFTIPGNHDIGYFEPGTSTWGGGNPWGNYNDLVKAYKKELGPFDQFFDFKGFRFVLFNNNPPQSKAPGHISVDQLKWIEGLLKSGKTTFIFCHIQLLEGGTGPPWGEAAKALIALFEKYNVASVAYGHKHEMHFKELNGIPYIMCPDLKVLGHQNILQYRIYRNCFELWLYDVIEGTATLAGCYTYPKRYS